MIFSEVEVFGGRVVRLLHEQLYSLTVNGRPLVSAMLVPEMLREFAIGYLVTEGVVVYDEVESVMVEQRTIGVLTRNPFKVLLPKKSVVSGCGGTATYLDEAKLRKIPAGTSPRAGVPSVVFPEDVLSAGGFSAAGFGRDAELVVLASEITQLAAFDKVVGAALLKGFSLADVCVVCSGKVTADLVRKALNAQVAVVFSCTQPTALAVETAQKGNLTLVKIPENILYTETR